MSRKTKTPPRVSRAEMRLELERISRESPNDAARISAIRQLREMDREDGERSPAGNALEELDAGKVRTIHRKTA